MTLKTKIGLAITAGAFAAGIVLPAGAFAATTVTVEGNGAGSTNKVKVNNKSKTKVKQSNKTAVVNLVGVLQNTGGNKANGNTGDGSVDVTSGNATGTVTNNTTTGSNVATVDGCVCEAPETTVDVKDNGADSTNKVKVNNKSSFKAFQSNKTLVVNGVLVAQNTGDNTASNNTGSGDVDVTSGDADATVTNNTTTGSNVLTVNP